MMEDFVDKVPKLKATLAQTDTLNSSLEAQLTEKVSFEQRSNFHSQYWIEVAQTKPEEKGKSRANQLCGGLKRMLN